MFEESSTTIALGYSSPDIYAIAYFPLFELISIVLLSFIENVSGCDGRFLIISNKSLAGIAIFDVIVDSYRITQDAWGREYHEDERISKLMQVLAHELSHVKQYIVGDLQTEVSGFAIWKGERFSPEDLQSYFDLPFEKEARGEEEGHMFAFLQRYTELQKEGIV